MVFLPALVLYSANPPNSDWSRWWEEKKRAVCVKGWARKAADFGGDEKKDSASDRQQLDTPAQQQLLQGPSPCRGCSEEVGGFVPSGTPQHLRRLFVSQPLVMTFPPHLFLLWSSLQAWVSGRPGHFASVPTFDCYIQLPSPTLSCCRLLCPE